MPACLADYAKPCQSGAILAAFFANIQIGRMSFAPVTALSDEEPVPPKAPLPVPEKPAGEATLAPKAPKAKAKGRPKVKPGAPKPKATPKKEGKAKPKATPKSGPPKAKAKNQPKGLKKPVAEDLTEVRQADQDAPVTSPATAKGKPGPKKRPAAAPTAQTASKKTKAKEFSVCKYRYKQGGAWGSNGVEKNAFELLGCFIMLLLDQCQTTSKLSRYFF